MLSIKSTTCRAARFRPPGSELNGLKAFVAGGSQERARTVPSNSEGVSCTHRNFLSHSARVCGAFGGSLCRPWPRAGLTVVFGWGGQSGVVFSEELRWDGARRCVRIWAETICSEHLASPLGLEFHISERARKESPAGSRAGNDLLTSHLGVFFFPPQAELFVVSVAEMNVQAVPFSKYQVRDIHC